MAVDIFLKIEGIDGESKDAGHPGEIDVVAWNWGMAQSGTSTGAARRSNHVNFQDLSFTHYMDRASPTLMLFCAQGNVSPEAVLTVRKAGPTPVEYVVITMTNCRVSSVSSGGSGGGGPADLMMEDATLTFAKVKVEYAEQQKDGTAGVTKEFSWNIELNESA